MSIFTVSYWMFLIVSIIFSSFFKIDDVMSRKDKKYNFSVIVSSCNMFSITVLCSILWYVYNLLFISKKSLYKTMILCVHIIPIGNTLLSIDEYNSYVRLNGKNAKYWQHNMNNYMYIVLVNNSIYKRKILSSIAVCIYVC